MACCSRVYSAHACRRTIIVGNDLRICAWRYLLIKQAMATQCSQLSLLLIALLFVTTTMVAVVSGQSVGEWLISESMLTVIWWNVTCVLSRSAVYLSLNGDTISNNGEVFFSDIGTEDSGLLCITNRSGCCRSSDALDGVAQGQWYRPNGTRVGTFGMESAIDPMDHFYRDRGTRVVRLNRVGNPPERGRFHCEVPNADGDLVNLYVNIIGEWFVSMVLMRYHRLCCCGTTDPYLFHSSGPTTNYISTCDCHCLPHHFFWYCHCWRELQSGVYCYCGWVN